MNEDWTRKRKQTSIVGHSANDQATKDVEHQHIIWRVDASANEISNTCVHLEELLADALCSCQSAVSVMARIDKHSASKDADLRTALTKYVLDTCKAIREVDNLLRLQASGLAQLLECSEVDADELSPHDLVALRDVFAHRLLAIDDKEVNRKAAKDFRKLSDLLSQIHFVPIKLDVEAGRDFHAVLNAYCNVQDGSPNERRFTGRDLVFIGEDRQLGFVSFSVEDS